MATLFHCFPNGNRLSKTEQHGGSSEPKHNEVENHFGGVFMVPSGLNRGALQVFCISLQICKTETVIIAQQSQQSLEGPKAVQCQNCLYGRHPHGRYCSKSSLLTCACHAFLSLYTVEGVWHLEYELPPKNESQKESFCGFSLTPTNFHICIQRSKT